MKKWDEMQARHNSPEEIAASRKEAMEAAAELDVDSRIAKLAQEAADISEALEREIKETEARLEETEARLVGLRAARRTLPGAPRPLGHRKGGLRDQLTGLLADGSVLSPSEIREALARKGLRHERPAVCQMLLRNRNLFLKVSRGRYRLRK